MKGLGVGSIRVAWWNLENLFDTVDDLIARDFDVNWGSLVRRVAVVLAVIATPFGLVGCGYSCGNGSSGHCYGTVAWGGATQGQGVLASVVHMSSGNIFVDDEAWVVDNRTLGGPYWVEIGEEAEGRTTSYFWADSRPGSSFIHHDLGPVPNGDYGQRVIYLLEQDGATPNQWDLAIFSPSTTDLRYLVQSRNNSMVADQDIMGQELAGSSGASADPADFLDAWNIDITPYPKSRSTDGSVRSDNPPQGTWVQHPSTTFPFGGRFQTKCC